MFPARIFLHTFSAVLLVLLAFAPLHSVSACGGGCCGTTKDVVLVKVAAKSAQNKGCHCGQAKASKEKNHSKCCGTSDKNNKKGCGGNGGCGGGCGDDCACASPSSAAVCPPLIFIAEAVPFVFKSVELTSVPPYQDTYPTYVVLDFWHPPKIEVI